MAETKTPTRRKRSTAAKKSGNTKAKTKTATRSKTTTAKTKAPARKGTAKKAAPKKVYEPHPIEYTAEGFQVGSDSAIIAAALTEGATTRTEVNDLAAERIEKVNGLQTRSGKDKYVPSMVSSILSRMLASGDYEVYASWQLVPIEKKKTTRKKK